MQLLKLTCVLVATDLDEGSRPALRTAARLAHLSGAALHVLHVADELAAGDVDRLHEHFQRLVPDAREPDSVQVVRGSPATVIVGHARRLSADALILGPHRQAEGKAGELGSTATSVVRNAPCPCLIAATELRLPLHQVLAPIDLSDLSRTTLSVAASWASALRPRDRNSHLTALHVASGVPSPAIHQDVHEAVEWARAHIGGAAHVEIHESVLSGADPAEVILQTAASKPMDLMVMGTRRIRNEDASLGSVPVAVVRTASCPLLLVPPPTRDRLAGA